MVAYLDPKLAVAVVIARAGRVLLGRRGANTRAPGRWSFPAGFVERGERVEDSVAVTGLPAHEVLPRVHLVFSLIKRWVLGTLQDSIRPEHVQAHVDERVFRFNRRRSRSRGLLFHTLLRHAVRTEPVTYQDLRKGRATPTAAASTWHAYTATEPCRRIPRASLARRDQQRCGLDKYPAAHHGGI